MREGKLCKTCIHGDVCFNDLALLGERFMPLNPSFFDNHERYEEYKKWEAEGFPCKHYQKELVYCKDCAFWGQNSITEEALFPKGRRYGDCINFNSMMMPETFFCKWGERNE